ncbi:hypothetical protein EMIT0324P_20401 [Pseudomonas chlororaphis]
MKTTTNLNCIFLLKLNLDFIKNIKCSKKNTYSSHTEQPLIHCPQTLFDPPLPEPIVNLQTA